MVPKTLCLGFAFKRISVSRSIVYNAKYVIGAFKHDRIMDIMYVFSKFKLKKAWFIAKYAFSIHILYRNLVPI